MHRLKLNRRLLDLPDSELVLQVGAEVKPYSVVTRLKRMLYQRAARVTQPGEFSWHGDTIDVFPEDSARILRLRFDSKILRAIAAHNSTERRAHGRATTQRALAALHKQGLQELERGDFVVHADHGIGKFIGVEETGRDRARYYLIGYGGGDTLRVPEGLEMKLMPYVGFTTPRLHRLGGERWVLLRKKAEEDVLKFARELLKVYAARSCAARPRYDVEHIYLPQFEADFAHNLTTGQIACYSDILYDLQKDTPMERVVLGDVGFGKTELAARAAYIAVMNGRQVAILAPTTILADQHARTLYERFASWPVKIEMLSRLLEPRATRAVIDAIQRGEVDIVIGTHRLLSRDISFRHLGLVVIDEEQRFGVKHKEKLKRRKLETDVLLLSATPIPRTLHMALAGVRDISVLDTAPEGKKPIVTRVEPWNWDLALKAIQSELARNGQVYYLHNRIETMGHVLDEFARRMPRVSVGVVHGQMAERQLMETFDNFRHGKIKVLVATTIVENGLDLHNVNTLIVDDATRLGLAQAHQLRGRIGRASVEAFAWFFYPSRQITALTRERLSALKKYTQPGAGYNLALRDLELRGAGNVLGPQQSGTVNAVGLNLYYQLLAHAVERLRHE